MLMAFLLLWIVWPLRGTIAARNIALVVGAISALLWLSIKKYKFTFLELLPCYCILCVPIWLIILYIFYPISPNLQWGDISGTWLRVILGIIFAIGLAKMFTSESRYQNFYFYILFIWPAAVALIFIYQGILSGSLFGEQVYIHILKSKISGVYFLIWSLTFCFAIFYTRVIANKNINLTAPIEKTQVFKVLVSILSLMCVFDYIFLKSLNAFVCLFICMLATTYMLINKKFHFKNRFLQYLPSILSIVGVISFVMVIFLIDASFYGNKLNNLFDDVNFIINYDNSGVWKCGGTGTRACFASYVGPYPPINPLLGVAVNGSTYERLNWLLEGLTFLKLHPFGLGYTGNTFGYYMAQQYAGSGVTKTHSGWLDFALGVGLPSLFAVWVAIALILRRAWLYMRHNNEGHLICSFVIWSLSICFILWCIAELSEREYIEHFFFMLAFFSIVSIGKSLKKN
jgi:hypothetical protein